MPADMVTVKHGQSIHRVPHCSSVLTLKLSLSSLTGLAPREMKLVRKGKVLASPLEPVPEGATIMLLRLPPTAAATLTVDIHEIVTGHCSLGVRVPAQVTHEDLIEVALEALHMQMDSGEGCCLRFYLPHLASLMRKDLALADYAAGHAVADNARPLTVFLVPCPPGLCAESTEAETEAALAAEAAAHARLLAQTELEVDSMHHTISQMMALPPSIVDAPSDAAAAGPMAEEAAQRARMQKACEAAGVPTRIRTGLMPAAEDVQVVPAPAELVAELEAYEAYDADIRELRAMPRARAKEVLIAAEEARLEERCALLIGSLPELEDAPYPYAATAAASPLPAERGVDSPRLPSTPRARAGTRGSGGAWGEPAAAPPNTSYIHATRASRARSQHASAETAADLNAFLSSEYTASCSSAASADGGVSLSLCGLAVEDEAAAEMVTVAEMVTAKSPGRLRAEALPAATVAAPRRQRPRCEECNLRLPLTAACGSACQCGGTFCAAHMHAHECSFDYHSREQRKLKEDNPKVPPSKLERFG